MLLNHQVGKDPFGIKEIYPTGRTNEEWFMNMNDPNHDPRTEPQTTLTKNSDGSWKIKSDASEVSCIYVQRISSRTHHYY